jgi:transient receptor potential cation channel subfamily M protein 3
LTQSEPDTEITGAAPAKGTMKAGRHMLLHIHAEYTSITDELESMIASPTTSLLDEKPKNLNELTNPEFVALMEKQHLKECEDDDYAIMEGLLQTKASFDGSDDNLEGGFDSDYSNRRMLRRETAIELPITPAKMQKIDETYTQQIPEYQLKNEKTLIRTSSMSENRTDENSPPNQRKMSYLNPDSLEQRYCKISDESLYKSSTETEYSAQPYHVIKQNSNDTNSSFNIDNSSFTNDLSLDAETSLNATVIENSNNGNDAEQRMPPKRASTLCTSDGRPSFLRKQFSMDQGNKRPLSENLECRSTTVVQHQQYNLPKMPSPRLHMHVLKESSSTSTEDTRDDSRKVIPTISTHLIQDEIAKLSLNIKSSTEEDDGSDENLETMC